MIAALPGERDAWVILASTDGIGGETVAALLARFGSARDVLLAARGEQLQAWADRRRREGAGWLLPPEVLERLARWPDQGPALVREIGELGLWTVTPLDGDYPPGLRDLDPAPPLLVGAGERAVLGMPRSVAVVGTRRPTPHGRALAGRVAGRLVECGAVVVSGLAIGIDGAAHAATLDRGGHTLAVIGGGHRHPGPRAHAALRERIVTSGGAIVSEFAPSVHPTRGTYPRRNMIIAALGQATIVVEAPPRSGALITAARALELGRQVLVAPGRIGDWAVAGSLALLRDTPARVLAGIDEMTEDLGLFGGPQVVAAGTATGAGTAAGADPATGAGTDTGIRRSGALALLSGAQREVAERICRAPAGLDVLVDETGLAPAVVSGAVTLLQMRGWIQPVGPAYLPAGPLLE